MGVSQPETSFQRRSRLGECRLEFVAGYYLTNKRRGFTTRPFATLSNRRTPESPRPPVDILRDYSPSFRQLERLTLYTGFLPPITQISSYSGFQHTLSYLSLQRCAATTHGIVTLVNYFPNLAHLDLSELCDCVGSPAPPFSRPLQTLSAAEFYTEDSLGFLDQLLGLRPQCEEIAIGMYWSSCPLLAQHVVDGVETSIKRLYLTSDLRGTRDVPKIV